MSGPNNGTRTLAKLEEQQRMTDRQRAELTELEVRHSKELAGIVSRHALEDRALELRHRRELAALWMHQGRSVGPWVERAMRKRDEAIDELVAAETLQPTRPRAR